MRIVTRAKCPECGWVFDLLDEDDAGEWYYGHDCEEPSCAMCARVADRGGPSHAGSTSCQSGSIASGGTKSHCSCDTCF
jgi:hypothetical protein